MASKWFYSHAGQKIVGPCSSADLRKLASLRAARPRAGHGPGGRMPCAVKASRLKGSVGHHAGHVRVTSRAARGSTMETSLGGGAADGSIIRLIDGRLHPPADRRVARHAGRADPGGSQPHGERPLSGQRPRRQEPGLGPDRRQLLPDRRPRGEDDGKPLEDRAVRDPVGRTTPAKPLRTVGRSLAASNWSSGPGGEPEASSNGWNWLRGWGDRLRPG